MVSVKAEDLQGAALDWAVAVSLKRDATFTSNRGVIIRNPDIATPDVSGRLIEDENWMQGKWLGYEFAPSTDWSQGGPLIEQYGVSIADGYGGGPSERWLACVNDIITTIEIGDVYARLGPTPLIAACRAIVAAKLGDEIDIPEDLAP